ncbi:Molybdopterin molybdenumtransferase [Sinobacterium norvegicum]|uniref:Molybdopterin molybdenumtransferase n=1 Tax=Sinobacterium norvegicum TaxID=1641715 RepID=A0ABM9AJ51_9GAMM|nr:gephyrin-like molybdotransferase Glp [Sinobacterium norvegicum]CAH0993268.1 Molybdopterin molybdenumtransferase [Sinobacterium norvegicum]
MSPSWTKIDDAIAQLLADARLVVESESVDLLSSLGRVLAADVMAKVSVPPFDNSAMDGYAVRIEDMQDGNGLPVTQRIAAGSVGSPLLVGEAARIFTGAPVPEGADAILMQENAEFDGSLLKTQSVPKRHQNIRRAGQDIVIGDIVFAAGHRIQPQDLGVLASVGVATLSVRRRLKVAVLSTGDELREPGDTLNPGEIFNSNRYTLNGLLQQFDIDIVDLGICRDTAEHTEELLRSAAQQADVIVSSGGVSVGEEDHVKAVVEQLGELKLWKLAIKPGKPLAYGKVLGVPFLGLPGNPAAVFVTFGLIVKPYLLRMLGVDDVTPLIVQLPAAFNITKEGRRQEYQRAKVVAKNGKSGVEIYANQSSGVLSSASWANCLAVIPAGKTIAQGDLVDVMLLDNLMG